MPFTTYVPDTKQWSDYFLNQVQSRGKNKKKSDKSYPIGGGISINDEAIALTTVGRLKVPKKLATSSEKIVKIEMTSPAETTLEQAESELKNIKGGRRQKPGISRKATKRKASSGGGASKGKKVKKYNDVFSKK